MLLLDEPLGALDLKLRRQMQIELKRIQTEVGITFVHVTHDQEEAMTMADTIAVMNEGVIEQMGAPGELYDSPATTFVSNFLGQSNLVKAEVRRSRRRATSSSTRTAASSRAPESRARRTERHGVGRRPAGEGLPGRRGRGSGRDGATVLRGGAVSDVSFIGVSTQYLVRMPLGPGADGLRAEQRRPRGRSASATRSTCTGRAAHTFLLDADQDAHAGDESYAAPRTRRRPRERRSGGGGRRGPARRGAAPPPRRRRSRTGYLLLLPGMLWLVVFFLLPTIQLVATSLYDPNGSLDTGYAMTWSFSNYWHALSSFQAPFLRSLLYAGVATGLALVLAYPLAYAIAFKAGRWKNLMLVHGDRAVLHQLPGPHAGLEVDPVRQRLRGAHAADPAHPRRPTVGCSRPRSRWSPG